MAEIKAMIVSIVIILVLKRIFIFTQGEYVIISFLLYWKMTELIEKHEGGNG